MTKDPACCELGDTVADTAQLMKDLDLGPLPVIENTESKKVIGILTDRDLITKIVAEGKDPKSASKK
jgi:CBS domain-containing protein